ncbi:MAG: hypothetical protein K2X39_07530, partial [Silvanigrellaceae bacterium]|nr:hypothetical protein [Silvanigrellaceae bacterium]
MQQPPFFTNDTPELAAIRKHDHIRICLNENIELQGSSSSSSYEAFAHLQLCPEALPEFNFDEIDTRQEFLGRVFSLPMLFTGMTGGVEQGQKINETLAQ